METRKKS